LVLVLPQLFFALAAIGLQVLDGGAGIGQLFAQLLIGSH